MASNNYTNVSSVNSSGRRVTRKVLKKDFYIFSKNNLKPLNIDYDILINFIGASIIIVLLVLYILHRKNIINITFLKDKNKDNN